MSLTGFINVTPIANQIFTNTGINDMVIYTQSNSQKIILGVNSNSIGNITLSSNLTSINGSTTHIGTITMSNTTGSVLIDSSSSNLILPIGSIPTNALNGYMSGGPIVVAGTFGTLVTLKSNTSYILTCVTTIQSATFGMFAIVIGTGMDAYISAMSAVNITATITTALALQIKITNAESYSINWKLTKVH